MTKVYDVNLRGIFKENLPTNLLSVVLGIEIDPQRVKFLDVKLPKLFEREADLLLEFENSIYHLEFQSTEDPSMSFRMLYYYLLIVENYKKYPKQVVIYVGEKPLKRMENTIETPTLKFSYQIVDLKEVDCKLLLESENPSDWIFATLCGMENELEQLRRVLLKIASLPDPNRKRYIEMLTNLLGLRPNRLNLLKREVQKMPITYDVRNPPLFKEGLELGLKEGMEKGLKEGMEKGLKEGLELGLKEGMELGLENAKRQDAINLYRKLKLSPEQIAETLEIPLQKVKKWLKEENLLKE